MSERAARNNRGAQDRAPEQTAYCSILPGEIMRAEDAFRRLNIGTHTARKMRRAGLKVIYYSGKSFLLAEDLAKFFRNCRDGAPTQPTTTERAEDHQHASHEGERSARSEGSGS